MCRIISSFCICFLMIGIVAGQGSHKSSKSENVIFLKINPFAIFETDAGIGFIGEYIWTKPGIAVQLEVQPVFFTMYGQSTAAAVPMNSIGNSGPLGVELRPEFKYYFEDKQGRNPFSSYVSIDFLYKHIDIKRIGSFSISNGGMATFNQIAIYNDIKTVVGFDIKFGGIYSLRHSQHWYVEPYIGFGLRKKSYSYHNIPLGASEPRRNEFLRSDIGTGINGISLPASIRLAYRF